MKTIGEALSQGFTWIECYFDDDPAFVMRIDIPRSLRGSPVELESYCRSFGASGRVIGAAVFTPHHVPANARQRLMIFGDDPNEQPLGSSAPPAG